MISVRKLTLVVISILVATSANALPQFFRKSTPWIALSAVGYTNYEMVTEGDAVFAVATDIAGVTGMILMLDSSGPCGPSGPYSFVDYSLLVAAFGSIVAYPYVSLYRGQENLDSDRVTRAWIGIGAQALTLAFHLLSPEEPNVDHPVHLDVLGLRDGVGLVASKEF